MKTIAYSKEALRTIGHQVQHDQRLRILPFGTISAVRNLKLNHKPIKGKHQQRTPLPSQLGSDRNNLITAKKAGFKPDQNIIFGTCNIQSYSLKNYK